MVPEEAGYSPQTQQHLCLFQPCPFSRVWNDATTPTKKPHTANGIAVPLPVPLSKEAPSNVYWIEGVGSGLGTAGASETHKPLNSLFIFLPL